MGMHGSMFRFLSRNSGALRLSDDKRLLRLPQYSDFAAWRTVRRESRVFLQPWEPTWNPEDLTERSFRARVNRYEQEYSSGSSISLFLFGEHDDLMGGITIGNIRRGASQTCMIGYWMGEAFAGQGHMKAALKLTVHHIFDRLQLHRIEAACIPENERSIGLLESQGFRREGHLREYLKIDGKWRDHIMLSRLSSDAALGKQAFDDTGVYRATSQA
jgi:[ribosomal protein S5]-alanine N-acetyltransferase